MLYQTRKWSFGGGSVTPAVKCLLVANVAVFVVQTIIGAGLDYRLSLLFGLVPRLIWANLYLWQLFTYQFLHDGLFHLLFNMLAVWMFGCTLERRWGTEFFLKYYFVSVLGGGILNTLFVPGQLGPSIGASAGVYGILLAFGLIYPEKTVHFSILFIVFIPLKVKLLVFIYGAITLYASLNAEQSGIAHLAHLGGMIFGYFYLRGGNPWDRVKLYLDRRRLTRLKRRFHLIEGGKDDDSGPTVH